MNDSSAIESFDVVVHERFVFSSRHGYMQAIDECRLALFWNMVWSKTMITGYPRMCCDFYSGKTDLADLRQILQSANPLAGDEKGMVLVNVLLANLTGNSS